MQFRCEAAGKAVIGSWSPHTGIHREPPVCLGRSYMLVLFLRSGVPEFVFRLQTEQVKQITKLQGETLANFFRTVFVLEKTASFKIMDFIAKTEQPDSAQSKFKRNSWKIDPFCRGKLSPLFWACFCS